MILSVLENHRMSVLMLNNMIGKYTHPMNEAAYDLEREKG
jgi:hypothetical protein